MSSVLLTYDPQAQSKWDAQYGRLPEIWRQAVREVRELGRMQPQTRADYIGAINGMRAARKRQHKTVADVARRVFNIVAARAALNGFKAAAAPDPESFGTLRELRLYFMTEMAKIKAARTARRPMRAYGLPVAPRGDAGMAFNDGGDPLLGDMDVVVPGIAGSAPFRLVWEHAPDGADGGGEGGLALCLSGPPHGALARANIAQSVTLLMECMFCGDDAHDVRVFVHHPIGTGKNGAEQYWAYDLRADGRGVLHVAGRTQMAMVPHGVANRRVMEDAQDAPLVVDRRLPYAPGVAMMVARQERYTGRREKVAQWRMFRPRPRFGHQ